MEIKPGTRLRSAVCDGEFVVVRWSPAEPAELRCGGHPMVGPDDPKPEGVSAVAGFEEGSLIGKRYTDEAGTIEVLCAKAGTSSLSLGDVPLQLKDAKPLPASD
jgi:hypothetical protein